MRGYISTNRSKHNLKAHIILVCKYRKKLLKGNLNNFIKAKIDDLSENGDFIIVAMESDIDHIHLMIQYLPRVSISSIIQKIKQITTFYVWRDERFGVFLRKHFWKEKTFWSDGFFVCSIDEANPETIKTYIENQG
ncbi:IS200/IS605 family transposase [Campylobacter upsaliensis]|uniref:IS200/IS605 family transposase n=1 Tax=Campylobacter upsaliensis TaxID=28080 RepID=UPI000E2069E2|nr:IS200/IS605 family transposase [Campylobacter upsaliensis]EAH6235861.1 IS200/IS605 family transposase [Campylobacter upsaliensis]EAI3670058.1 IS200/IS605 family transposase [Campylobacter upsaliensis]EAI4326255.1 IS200/IS605 family transposase [Campylobacter upsaliensis]EAJ0468483.1 IS200/IS605 family transposase [Campylobacter upsaliensis]EAJ0668784.1 IS200/IS605 family transposase [Campylobacter upsaliensis]